MKRLFLYLLLITATTAIHGQQRLPNRPMSGIGDDLGNNLSSENRRAGRNPADTTEVTNVPVDLNQWTLSPRLGNVRPVEVDTVYHLFQNEHLTEGMNGEYNHLGNFGSPRLSRIFFNRPETTQRFFTDVYDFFYKRPDQFKFTDTKSPFTNLTYHSAGNKLTGDDHIKAYFATNANSRFGIGFLLDYLYGRGQYNSQSNSFFNASIYSYYRGERYQAYFLASKFHMKSAENGGITNDKYITDPLEMAEGNRTYDPEDIPTKMDRAWNRNVNWNFFLTHRYNVGFYRENEDLEDTTKTEIFVPVTSFIHTADISTNEHSFISYNEPKNYYLNNYLPHDSLDQTKYLSVKNTLAIALKEGFNKWAQAGLTAFITHEYRQFSLPDTLVDTRREYRHKYTENNISIGGELSKTLGKSLHYNVTGETVIAGDDIGQFSLEGRGDLNFRLFKDTVRLDVHAFIKNTRPAFFYRHYHSHHYWWDNDDLSKEFRTRITGGLTLEHTHTRLSAGVENIKNYTYLANHSAIIEKTSTGKNIYGNSIKAAQCNENIQVFSATLKQDFKLAFIHLDCEATYQKSSDNTVLPLPELSVYGNLYIPFRLAKVLRLEFGADIRYFSKYDAPDYAPALGQFVQQNQAEKLEIGGYPFVNLYLNAHLKRTRFYAMMYHVNQGTGDSNYFLAPHYPINPRTFQIGLSWNFFD